MSAKGKKFRLQASKTTNTYVYCYLAARKALKSAQEEQPGWLYFAMMAGAFAAFTVEAFLNHVGQQKLADWDAFERRLGPRDKLLLLKGTLHLSVDQSKRPFQTLVDMLRLRDALAHGKTVTVKTDLLADQPHDDAARYPEPDWKKLCSLESITRMVEDAQAMVLDLSRQSGTARDPFASSGHGSSDESLVQGE